MDMSKLNLNVQVNPGKLTSEFQAIQQSHGLNRTIVIMGAVMSSLGMASTVLQNFPQAVSIIGMIGGILSAITGMLQSNITSNSYQAGRVEEKVAAHNANASIAQAAATVGVEQAKADGAATIAPSA